MSKKIWYVNTYDKQGMKAALLWDETTDAWQYSSNAPAKDEEQYYRIIPTIFRGVNLISQAVSNMPFTIYQGEAEFDTSQDYQNKLEWLPSPGALFGMISQSLDLAGRCYLRPLRNSGSYVKELRYYSPVTIEPKYDEQAGSQIGFIRTANSRQDLIPVEDLIYFWLKDPYVELGPPSAYPIKAAMNAAGALKSLDDFVTLYFQRGAVRPMMVYAKGMPQKEERERLEGWFNNLMGGIKNAFRWKVFNAEALDVKQIGDGLSELRLGSPVPPTSTSPATAADSCDGSPDESPTAKPDPNFKSEPMTLREWDDLQWILGTGRFRQ
jgi:phage portal protein BeeE